MIEQCKELTKRKTDSKRESDMKKITDVAFEETNVKW